MPDIFFSSENLDTYLKELAKEFRKINGKTMPAEVILVGGAAILANYGFRDKTYDVDAIIHATSAMKEAANRVADKFSLPNGWLNSDFKNTKSYSHKLELYSKHYKTFSNIVEFRIISGEYLMAMKLMSGRTYKHDLSDVAEIYYEHIKINTPISYNDLMSAITNLYGEGAEIPETSSKFIKLLYTTPVFNIEKLIMQQKEIEENSKNSLIQFEEKYETTLNDSNVTDILSAIEKKKKQ